MWCCRCNKQFPRDCACEDRDKRVESMRGMSGVASRVCSVCNKHADLCECPDGPSTVLESKGQRFRIRPQDEPA